jgi:hypothetical protein
MYSLSRICFGAFLAAGMFATSLSHASTIFIKKIDSRAFTNVSFSLEFNVGTDPNSVHYADWEMLGGTWGNSCPGVRWQSDAASYATCNGNQCTGDFLRYLGSLTCNGNNWLEIDRLDDQLNVQNLTVYANFTTPDGACHHDYEDIASTGTTYLVLDGNNGSYSNGCYYGDFLRHQ